MRTWKDNAAEFVALSKQGIDVRLAVLIATSVEQGTGGARTVTNVTVRKVSAREFAEAAGTSAPRVLRHLDAWNRAAEQGLCSPSTDLVPEDANDADLVVPSDEDFRAHFTVPDNAGGRTMGNVTTAVRTFEKRGVDAVLDALPAETLAEVAKAAVQKTDPITRNEITAKHEPVVKAPSHGTTSREIDENARRRRQDSGVTWVLVDDAIEDVAADALHQVKRIAFALEHAKDAEFTEQEMEDLAETLERAKKNLDRAARALGTFEASIHDTSKVDWDAELAKITGAEQ